MPTSQPTPSFRIPKSIRITAQVTQRLSTKLAARLAWHWFLTPYAFKIPAREVPMEERFAKTMVPHPLGPSYPLFTLGSGQKRLLLIHGWAGRFTQFQPLLEALEAAHPALLEEYTIIGFNALAHRGAQGKRTMMPEFGQIIQQIHQKFGTLDLVFAHSLGCNALLYAEQHLGVAVKQQVLFAPPGRISAMVDIFVSNVGFKAKVKRKIIENLSKIHGADFDQFSAPELAPTNTVRTLVLHDVNDYDTPIALGREVGERMSNGTYVETHGLGHRRILRDRNVLSQILDWISF
jgi:pimeloyl-ACP methyl ester carboxylesterase